MNRNLFLCGVLVMAAGGCAGGDEPVEQSQQDLYVKGVKIWTTLSIPVCWENPAAATPTERGWVQNKIRSTWSAVSDVTFIGWEACAAGQAGIHVRIADVEPHVNAYGRDLDGLTNGLTLNFTFNNWTSACRSAVQHCVEATAVREFGHALGFGLEINRPDTPAWCNHGPLADSDTTIGAWDQSSIMNDCAPTWFNGGNLSATDVIGVRQFYGSPTYAPNRKAAVVWPNRKIYFFNGPQYARYDIANDRIDSGYPADISTYWHNWPPTWTDGVDAAVDWGNGKAYFFRDAEYLRYDIAADRVDPGYPAPIVGNWRGWPPGWTSVDAVVKTNSSKAYFFYGAQYVRYDIAADQVDPGYPASMTANWPGLFTALDYGFLHPNGYVYFFKGQQFQTFDLPANRAKPPLPIVGTWPGVAF